MTRFSLFIVFIFISVEEIKTEFKTKKLKLHIAILLEKIYNTIGGKFDFIHLKFFMS